MIIEGQLEKKAAATNDWTTGLIPATSMDNKRDEELSEQTRKLQLQSEHCGSDGDQWELVAGHWCTSDTFQLLNLIFLFIYILDVVFKVYLSISNQIF